MADRSGEPSAAGQRGRAEEHVAQEPAARTLSEADSPCLLHELQVHQIQLETQNAELRLARAEIQEALERYTELYDFAPVGYFTLSGDGAILQINLAGARVLNADRSQLIGRRLADFVGSGSRATLDSLLQRATLGRAREACDLELLIPGRPTGPLFVRIEALADAAGRTVRAAIFDIADRKQAEEALKRRERYQRAVLDNFPFMVWLKDRESRLLAVNQIYADVAGMQDPTQLVGTIDLDYWAPELANRYRADDRAVLDSGRSKVVEEEIEQNGRRFWIETYKSPVTLDGRVIGTVGFARDITARKQAEESLRLAASVFSHAREAIIITTPNGDILDVNQAFTRITGYGREEVLSENVRILGSGLPEQDFYDSLWRDLTEKGHWYGEFWSRRKSGEVYAVMQTIGAVRDDQGEVLRYVVLFSDITLLKEHQRQMERIAHFDPLTGLPNRVLLADRLHQAIEQAQRRGTILAVAYLDLDGFKAVNDAHGHEIGDKLLTVLARRMKQTLRDGDTLARLGGDEFFAVLTDLADHGACAPILDRLLGAAAEPALVDEIRLQVSASLGVTFFPQSEDVDADQLMRQSDQAMYHAKQVGKNRYHVFDAEQDRNARGHHESLERIRQALAQREFVLHYQPKVNLRTGEVIGVEALIRWNHPQQGLLPPAAFLPVIRDHPLCVEVGDWVIESALTQVEAWKRGGVRLPVSINIDARQLQQPDFVEKLRERLAAHPGIGPGDLVLEVLETSALEGIVQVSDVILGCRELGIGFALDDFGTGYSSLTYLKRLPVKFVKIDQSFVRDMLDEPEDLVILEGILGLARAFRRQTIAEGVETRAHGELLLRLGCELGQGYAIARPMAAEAIPGWMATWRPDPAWLSSQPTSRSDFPILVAAVEHRAWFKGVEDFLTGTRETPPVLNAHECRFGIWLDDNPARQATSAGDGLAQIQVVHAHAHDLASELIQLQATQRNAEARERLPELRTVRDRLIELLWGLASGGGRRSQTQSASARP